MARTLLARSPALAVDVGLPRHFRKRRVFTADPSRREHRRRPQKGDRGLSITVHALLVVAAAVVVALAGRAALHRIRRPGQVAEAEPTAEMVIEAMAGLYGGLVAFLLSGAWERFDQTRGTMTLEANTIADLRQIATVLPAPQRDEFSAAVAAYREGVLAELPLLAEGGRSREPDVIIDRLWRILADFEPATPGQTDLQSRAFDAVEELANQRRIRLYAIRRSLPPILWVILIGGAAAILGVVASSSAEGRLPAIYLALLAAVISVALFAIYALSHPIRSGLAAELVPFIEDLRGGPPGGGTQR